MSVQITEAMVKQYSANVFHLSQQKESRLAPLLRKEKQVSEAAFYDRIGSVTAQKKTSRHADTTYMDTPHSRRMITLDEYFYADLVDKEDKVKVIQNPESEYAKAASMALGRAMDSVIISAALGNAYSGKDGATPVALANANKVAAFDGTTTTGCRLTIKTLRAVKKLFNKNEVAGEELVFVWGAEQEDDLLATTEATSSDYNTVKALVSGQIDSFMGFKFVRVELLPTTTTSTTYNATTGAVGSGGGTLASGARRCFAFAKSGMLMAMGQDMKTSIDVLPTKHFSTQVYASMQLGATRLEEVKVVEVLCKE